VPGPPRCTPACGSVDPWPDRHPRHRFVVNHIWEPQWASGTAGLTRRLLHGWGFHGIFSIQSGFPTNIFAGTRRGFNDGLLLGGSNVRADFSGSLAGFTPVPQGSPGVASIPSACARGVVTTNTGAICTNTSGFPFTQPLLGHAATLGRNAVRLNRLAQFDWAFVKNTYITETHYVQFRFEMFNVFNNTSFSRFVNILSSSSFGQCQGTDTNSRRLQVGLKYIF